MPTLEDLGQKLKAKYPGSYDQFSDLEVGTKLKTKYPDAYQQFSMPGMEKLGGVPPAAGKRPAAPEELALNEGVAHTGVPQAESPDGGMGGQYRQFITSPHGFIREGLRQAGHGIEAAAQPGWDAKLGGASEVIRGLGTAAIPAAIPAAIAHPGVAATAMGLGGAAQFGTEHLAPMVGVPPGASALAGDVAGLAAGGAGGGGAGLVGKIRGASDNPELQKALTDFIPYYGAKINKLREATGAFAPTRSVYSPKTLPMPEPETGPDLSRSVYQPTVLPRPIAPPPETGRSVYTPTTLPRPVSPPPETGRSVYTPTVLPRPMGPEAPPQPLATPPTTQGIPSTRGQLNQLVHNYGIGHGELSDIASMRYGVSSMADLTDAQMADLAQSLGETTKFGPGSAVSPTGPLPSRKAR